MAGRGEGEGDGRRGRQGGKRRSFARHPLPHPHIVDSPAADSALRLHADAHRREQQRLEALADLEAREASDLEDRLLRPDLIGMVWRLFCGIAYARE